MSTTREEKIQELLKTPRLSQIRKLYRYRSMESRELEAIFTRGEIFLPRPIDFNDPFECRPRLTVYNGGLKRKLFLKKTVRERITSINKITLKEHIKEFGRRLHENPTIIEKAYEDFLRATGIYCLSENNSDILMWSHYSNGHRGLCLEFDAFHDAAFAAMMLFGQAIKVNYSEERPVVNVMDIGEPEEYQKALLTKSKHWDYEQEWRIIKTHGEGGPGVKPFRPSSLTGVIFGALMSPEDKHKVKNWITRYPTKIALYEAKINETNYQVDIEPIN